MTLQEALATGKNIRRISVGGEFLSYEDYVESLGIEREDVLATDWEVGNETEEFTETDIAAAWNAARGSSLAIKSAGQSDFYRRFVANLFTR